MTDLSNQAELQKFLSDEMNNFTSMYAGFIQEGMQKEWDIEISHRECWEIITSLISQMFPNEVIEIKTMEKLKEKILKETVDDVRDIILSKYSNHTVH
jgi:hypothetical protein